MIAWNYEGTSDPYLAKLGIDEMHGFTGLGNFSGDIARLYAVMLRRMNFGWTFFLSMHSLAGLEMSCRTCVMITDARERSSGVCD